MSELLRGPVTVANLTAAAGVETGADGWWPCLNLTWRTPVPASITKITAQVRERGTTSPVAETVMTAVDLAAGTAKVVNGVSVGQHLQVRLAPAGAPGLPFQPTPWVDVTTPWDALIAELDGLKLGCFTIVCGVGVPTRTDLEQGSLYVREDVSQLWQYEAGAGTAAAAANIVGTDLKSSGATNVVTLTGYTADQTVRFSKPLVADSGGLLSWDAYSAWASDGSTTPTPPPVVGQTWSNEVTIKGNTGGADTTLFSATLDANLYTTAALAFAALAAQLPVEFTGYSEYKIVGTTDPNPSDNRGGLSILVEEVPPGWVLMSTLTSIRANGVEVEGSPRSLDFTGAGVSLAVGDDGSVVVDIPGGGGAGVDLGWFNVVDYGALGDGSTDDTTAIQDAIDACETAGGGTVYFPRGTGEYIVGGALQDTGRSNAQLLLPRRDYGDTECITIVLRGEAPPPSVYSVVTATTPVANNLSVIKGTLTSGTGALIGAHGPSGTLLDFSNVNVVIRDLTVQMPANPTLTALDLSRVAQLDADNLMVHAGNWHIRSISAQTTSTSCALRAPGVGNGGATRLGIVTLVGFYNGLEVGEHTTGQDVNIAGCKQACVFPANYHSSHFDRLLVQWCQKALVFTGVHYFNIDHLNIEHADASPWLPVYDIDDASDYGHGHLRWHVALANVGIDNTFTVNGAANIAYRKMDKDFITSPTTGALAKFNDAYSLTVGNLSGDATTSDSLVVTLAASGVSAGTYSNATVTVDAKGRVTSIIAGSAAAYMPLVTGAQPPILVDDGAGHLIAVGYAP